MEELGARRRGGNSEGSSADKAPVLDEHEQDAVIANLEREAAALDKRWRGWFSLLFLLLAALYALQGYHHLAHPWGLKHHAQFYSVHRDPRYICVIHGFAFVSLLMAGTSQFVKDCDRWIKSATCFAIGVFCFWAWSLFQLGGVRRDTGWLPFPPAVAIALLAYVKGQAAEVRREAAGLRALKYAHKKV